MGGRDRRAGGRSLFAPVLVLEFAVDGHGGPRTFGGGDDDELDVPGRVARHEQAGHTGILPVVGPDPVVRLGLASQS